MLIINITTNIQKKNIEFVINTITGNRTSLDTALFLAKIEEIIFELLLDLNCEISNDKKFLNNFELISKLAR